MATTIDQLLIPEVLEMAQKYSAALDRVEELEGKLRDARAEIESLEYSAAYWKDKARWLEES